MAGLLEPHSSHLAGGTAHIQTSAPPLVLVDDCKQNIDKLQKSLLLGAIKFKLIGHSVFIHSTDKARILRNVKLYSQTWADKKRKPFLFIIVLFSLLCLCT